MEVLRGFLQNKVLAAAIWGWFFAQLTKFIINRIANKKFNLERLWGSGGMPSSHSSMVSALTISVARFYGVSSPVFAIAVMFAFVTLYDAMGVRLQAGLHARLLNKYLNEIEIERADEDGDGIPDKEFDEIELKEFIGHTPLEVLGGVLMGIIVGIVIPA